MLEGECPKCKARYIGWALRFPRNQICNNCGTALRIKEEGKVIAEGYSPFTAEEHVIDLSPRKRPSRARSKSNPEEAE